MSFTLIKFLHFFEVVGASEASSDSIFDSRKTHAQAEGKDPVPANKGKCFIAG